MSRFVRLYDLVCSKYVIINIEQIVKIDPYLNYCIVSMVDGSYVKSNQSIDEFVEQVLKHTMV